MTCLIAVQNEAGVTVVGADTCVSWRLSNPENYVYKDELQKLYGVHPRVLVAVSGQVIGAQAILDTAKKLFRRENADRKLYNSVGKGWVSARLVSRILRTAVSQLGTNNHKIALIIAVARGDDKVDVYSWSSWILKELWVSRLEPASVIVAGSLAEDRVLHAKLEKMLIDAANTDTRVRSRPLDSDNLVATVSDRLNRFMAENEKDARRVGVGGMFQLATLEGGQFVAVGYSAEQIARCEETIPSYRVQLRYDVSDRSWYQENTNHGTMVRMATLENSSFSRIPGSPNLFRWTSTDK